MADANEVPRLKINPDTLLKDDIELTLASDYSIFYRRIVEFVLLKLENALNHDILIILEHEGQDFELALPRDGYVKSLNKALDYFLSIEEYETCGLIEDIKKQI